MKAPPSLAPPTRRPIQPGPEPLESRLAPAAAIAVSNLQGANGFSIEDRATTFPEFDVTHVGDVNGDSVADILLTRTYQIDNADGSTTHGHDAFVIFGHAGAAFPAHFDVASLDGTNGFALDDASARSLSVAGPGDVNGDGIADLVIGARRDYGADTEAGHVYVVFGSKISPGPRLDLAAGLDPTRGYTITGGGYTPDPNFGSEVSAVGDVNGDGRADFAVDNQLVFFGLATAPASPLSTADASLTLDATLVAAAGDVNHDGVADLIYFSSHSVTVHGRTSDAAYVLFGRTDLSSSGSLPDPMDGRAGFQIDGLQLFGSAFFSVGGGGDLNGDGIDDLAIGQEGGYRTPGQVFVLFGHAGSFAPRFHVAALNGRNGFRLVGARGDADFGAHVDVMGDVNGDGMADLLARSADETTDTQESAHVLYGHRGPFAASSSVVALNGVNGYHVESGLGQDSPGLAVLSSLGDVNGDGYGDFAFARGEGPLYVVLGGPADANVSGAPGVLTFARGGHTAAFTDLDGDHVTVTVSRGHLTPENFTLVAEGAGARWVALDLAGDHAFDGAHLKVTATSGAAGGDGHVSLESLQAGGVHLGHVLLPGRLGQIVVGDGSRAAPGLLSLRTDALGADPDGNVPDGTQNESILGGSVGHLFVQGDARFAHVLLQGSVEAATIGGSLIGGEKDGSGLISSGDYGIGRLVIGGDIRGGAGEESGAVDVRIVGALEVDGRVVGGDGEASGQVFSFLRMRGLVAGGVQGGAGWYSGRLVSVHLSALQVGPIEGGDGLFSGGIATTAADRLTVTGGLIGGTGAFSGSIDISNPPSGASGGRSRLEIDGSIVAGAGEESARIVAGQVASLVVHGAVRGGVIAAETFDQLTVYGGLAAGDDGRRTLVAAEGKHLGRAADAHLAFGSIEIRGSVAQTDFLAGYLIGHEFFDTAPTAVSGDARIGSVQVSGDWVASNLVAGVGAGADGTYGVDPGTGVSDDTLLAGTAAHPSQVGTLTIVGTVSGTPGGSDHFAFTAQRFGRVTMGGKELPLTAGPDTLELGSTGDVVLREAGGAKPPPAAPVVG